MSDRLIVESLNQEQELVDLVRSLLSRSATKLEFLQSLSQIEDCSLFKSSKNSKDSIIYRLKPQGGVDMLVKVFPDVWRDSLRLFGSDNSADNIRFINQSGITPRIIDSFSGSVDSTPAGDYPCRVVVYNFEEGQTVVDYIRGFDGRDNRINALSDSLSKLRLIIKPLRDSGYYVKMDDPNNFIVTPDGGLKLTDTNQIVIDDVQVSNYRLRNCPAGAYRNWSSAITK